MLDTFHPICIISSYMKTITLAQAFAILTAASLEGGIIVDHAVTDRIHMHEITGNGENQFAHISWRDEDDCERSTAFTEENNQAPQLNGSVLLLTDDEGEPTALTILMPANLEA